MNGHGANYQPLQTACRDIRDLTGALVAVANFYTLPDLEEMLKYVDEGTLKHAAEWDTSLLLALDEKNVDNSKIVKDEEMIRAIRVRTKYASRDEMGGRQFAAKVMVAEKNIDFSILGVVGDVGDPTLATKERGEKLVNLHAERLAEVLVDFSTWEYGNM